MSFGHEPGVGRQGLTNAAAGNDGETAREARRHAGQIAVPSPGDPPIEIVGNRHADHLLEERVERAEQDATTVGSERDQRLDDRRTPRHQRPDREVGRSTDGQRELGVLEPEPDEAVGRIARLAPVGTERPADRRPVEGSGGDAVERLGGTQRHDDHPVSGVGIDRRGHDPVARTSRLG